MIIRQLNNGSPMSINSGMAIKKDYVSIKPPTAGNANDFCYCDYECEESMLVFYSNDGLDYKNDKTSILFRRYGDSDTVTMKLFKNGIELTIFGDNTYGIYYPQIINALPYAEAYVGYLIDWKKVFNEHGTGDYQIKTSLIQLGAESEVISPIYQLMQYSDELADGTVVFESWQNGNIISSAFDFTNINWYSAIRIQGKFYASGETFETDEYLTQNYQRKQLQDKIVDNYTLETNLIPRSFSKQISQQGILADKILVTDYNLFNEEILRQIQVRPKEITKDNYSQIRKSKYTFTFTGEFENTIKRNN